MTEGKGERHPSVTGTWIANANVGPSARAPANGTVDLAKFRTGQTEQAGEGEGEKTVHCAAPAACRRGFTTAAANTCAGSEEEEEERTWTATARAAKPDSVYEWDQVPQRFVAFLYPH